MDLISQEFGGSFINMKKFPFGSTSSSNIEISSKLQLTITGRRRRRIGSSSFLGHLFCRITSADTSLAKMDPNQPQGENYANPKTCFFHVIFKAAALAFYILSALFFDNFVIIFVVTVLLAALDFWVVKNVSGRILVGLRWWNEINDLGESVWKFESLDQESLARMNKKDSWLFWWTLYLTAAAWVVLGIFSLIRFQADYCLVIGVCLTLSIANIVGFTKCRKDAKKQFQQFAQQTIANRVSSTIQSAFSVV